MVNVLLEAQVDKILSEMDGKKHREELYQYFRFTQDVFYPINKWPQHMRERILQEHKSNSQRYHLWVFLVWNGLPPHLASQWTLSHHVSIDGKRLIQGDYDAKARRQVFEQLPKMFAEKRLGPRKMQVFDFNKNEPVSLGDMGY